MPECGPRLASFVPKEGGGRAKKYKPRHPGPRGSGELGEDHLLRALDTRISALEPQPLGVSDLASHSASRGYVFTEQSDGNGISITTSSSGTAGSNPNGLAPDKLYSTAPLAHNGVLEFSFSCSSTDQVSVILGLCSVYPPLLTNRKSRPGLAFKFIFGLTFGQSLQACLPPKNMCIVRSWHGISAPNIPSPQPQCCWMSSELQPCEEPQLSI